MTDYTKIPLVHVWVSASRWPWQGYGWGGTSDIVTAPLASGARFGGGWKWKLGIDCGGSTVILNLVFGMIRITTSDPAVIAAVWEKFRTECAGGEA